MKSATYIKFSNIIMLHRFFVRVTTVRQKYGRRCVGNLCKLTKKTIRLQSR